MSRVSLSGSVAVVTGGSRGIGMPSAAAGRHGAPPSSLPAAMKRRLNRSRANLQPRGHRGEGVACDVTDLASVEALGEHLRNNYGRVDILVNNAGIRRSGWPAA